MPHPYSQRLGKRWHGQPIKFTSQTLKYLKAVSVFKPICKALHALPGLILLAFASVEKNMDWPDRSSNYTHTKVFNIGPWKHLKFGRLLVLCIYGSANDKPPNL